MSNNSSIASRMRELAELKRSKVSGSSESLPGPDSTDTLAGVDAYMTDSDEGLRVPDAFVDDHEPEFAPELGTAYQAPTEPTLMEAEDESWSENSTEAPEVQAASSQLATPSTEKDSLDDYFSALGIEGNQPEPVAEEPSDEDFPAQIASEAELSAYAEDTPPSDTMPEQAISAEIEAPDFSETEIDPEIIAREFEHEADDADNVDAADSVEDEALLSVTFDESRSTLLAHVSAQMGCSVDDVVVTALDWYLDALFAEEAPQQMEATG